VIDWSLRGRVFVEQLGPEARRTRRLSARLDTNDSAVHIELLSAGASFATFVQPRRRA
jgi:hypothetical protein